MVSFIWGRRLLADDDDDLPLCSRSTDWLRDLPTALTVSSRFTLECKDEAASRFTSDVFTWSSDLVRERRHWVLAQLGDLCNDAFTSARQFLLTDRGLGRWVEWLTAGLLEAMPSLLTSLAEQLSFCDTASSLHILTMLTVNTSNITSIQMHWQ